MAPLERWNDDRLDDLHRQVERMSPVIEQIGVLAEQMRSLGRSMDLLRKDFAVAGQRTSSLKIGLICAVSGGLVGSLTMIVTGHHP